MFLSSPILELKQAMIQAQNYMNLSLKTILVLVDSHDYILGFRFYHWTFKKKLSHPFWMMSSS